MMNKPDNKSAKHSYELASEISKICEPLFKAFDLNYFDYVRLYKDNSCCILTSDHDWYLHYMNSKYPVSGTLITSGVHLWQAYAPEVVIRDHASHFEHHHGVTIFFHNNNCIEYIDLAAPSRNYSIMDIYLNKLHMIQQFFFHFKDKAAKLIEQADKRRMILSAKEIPKPPVDASFYEFQKILKDSRFCLQLNNNSVSFTKREFECLLHLAQGKSMKEIAKNLNISPKTVEEYLGNAKNKTSCPSRAKLIEDFHSNFSNSLSILKNDII